MVDHADAAAILQRVIAGADVAESDVAEALDHLASCDACSVRFEVADLAACADVEDQLLEAARLQAAGEDAAGPWPELAEHLVSCSRCRATLRDLAEEPAMEHASGAAWGTRRRSLFERVLTDALAAPEPIMRLRAAERLAELDRLG